MDRIEGIAPSGLQELVQRHLPDFQAEIRQMLDETDLSLVNLEAEPADKACLHALYVRYHAIGGLLGLMREPLGQRLALASETLVETLRKYRPSADAQGINQLVQSARFLRRLVTEAAATEDSRLSGEIGQHVQAMMQSRADLMLEIRQPLAQETRIGEILVRQGTMAEADVADLLSRQQASPERTRFGELLLREKRVEASDIIKAIRMQKLRTHGVADPSVRVPLARIDEVGMLIEQLQAKCRTLEAEALLRFGNKDRFATETGSVLAQLKALGLVLSSLRLVTLREVFAKLAQTVGSLIEESHRAVRVTTLGESVEVDKALSDQLLQPLADLLALFLETTAGQEGEDALGLLEVVAYREGDGLHVDVTGDARGDLSSPARREATDRLVHAVTQLGGRLSLDDDRGGGIRARLLFPEREVNA